MNIGPVQLEIRERSRATRLKLAVLASFHEPAPSMEARLREFTARDWDRATYWLDVSGLALYFLDRIEALKLHSSIPESFLARLRTRLDENRQRTDSLLAEALMITKALRERNIDCAVLKGATIARESVPDISFRNQMDLDLLIREEAATAAQSCLADQGYSLQAISGNTWEFKAGPSGHSSLKNLYQVRPERSVEVHLQHALEPDRLARAEWRSISGHLLPALSSEDLFLLQGQHLFKHMCGEYTRASWVLEYWRHVCARRSDATFWLDVETVAAEMPGSGVAIGAATLLTSSIFGPCAPRELSRWSMDRLRPGICLWIHLYGSRLLLSHRPGSKVYLLLRKELEGDSARQKSARRRLIFPFHWPQKITRKSADESLSDRVRRFRIQASFTVRRFWFHLAGGLGLAIESLLWQRRNGRVSQ